MTETRLVWLAEVFWRRARPLVLPDFPVDIGAAISWVLPLDVRPIPNLSTVHLFDYARQFGIEQLDTGPERRLRGCLLACRGEGAVFVDSTDAADEQRLTLAHEAAHFLIEYEDVRERVRAALGPEALGVLDGERPSTADEWVTALLGGVEIGVHAHLMERGESGERCVRVAEAECTADRLALELLAPEDEVRRRFGLRSLPDIHDERVDALTALLTGDFGLPRTVAVPYARALVREWYGGRSVRELFGL